MRRYALSVPLGVLATAGLLLGMVSLVSRPTPPVSEPVRAHFVDRVELEPPGPICKCASPAPVPAFPLVRRAPLYPPRALQRGVAGWVRVRFSISPAGTVIDPAVLDSEPAGIFERAALRAVIRWRYMPSTRAGAPVWDGDELVLRFRSPSEEVSL